uniref:Chitin-binding type-2 domain-containing protein n=1 Tax=Steinernema glaseri TaxID=37863 RepID=A0A1I7ZNK3_9BILA
MCPNDAWTVQAFIQSRERLCEYRPKGCAHTGFYPYCLGKNIDQRSCMTVGCNPTGLWSEWTAWSKCEGAKEQLRKRTCTPQPLHCVPNIGAPPNCA